MASGLIVRRWRAVIAAPCMLAAMVPASGQAQQSPAAARRGHPGLELRNLTREDAGPHRVPGEAITRIEEAPPASVAGKELGVLITGRPLHKDTLLAKRVNSGAKQLPIAGTVLGSDSVRQPAQYKKEAFAAERPGDPSTSNATGRDKLPVEVVPQMGHTSNVKSAAFSSDGRLVLSGSIDNTVKLWDAATGHAIRTFAGHSDLVSSVAFSPDSRLILSGSWDDTLKLWDAVTGKELRTFTGHSGDVMSATFSPDGRTVLSGSWDGSLKLWDAATGKELRTFMADVPVLSIAFSPDGRSAISGLKDGAVRIWDIATGRVLHTFSGHSGKVTSVAFSPDGRGVLSGGEDQTLKLWDAATGKKLRTFSGHPAGVITAAFSPDGRIVLSGSWDSTLKLWDVATGQELRTFAGQANGVTPAAFSPDGHTAVSGNGGKSLKLWDTATGEEIRSLTGHSGGVSSVALSRNGRTALSGSFDKTLRLWDTATGKVLHTFAGHSGLAVSAAISPDGRTALSGSWDGTLKLWSTATGEELRTFSGHSGDVTSVAFSPDGRTALSGSEDQTLKLWDIATGQALRTFEYAGSVTSVAISPDGRTVLSGSNDKTVNLWDIATGELLHTFKGHSLAVTSVAFSADGRIAASGSYDKTLRLWDTATGRELRVLTGHSGAILSAALSPDGRFAISGYMDSKTLTLWNTATGQELHTFTGHSGWVNSVAFSPDGRTAFSGSSDGTTRVWDIDKGRELALMKAAPDGEWLTITPTGFFSSSHRDTNMLAIVRGAAVTTIGQVYQSLFNPDLVREALAGDPDGEVKRAAEAVSLDKVLAAAPPPAITLTSHETSGHFSKDLITIPARVTDRGNGVGRIEWRVNGITAGVTSAPAGPGPDYEVSQELALEPGENQIEVIAYEKRNLLASLPARATIAYDGPADAVKPRLHILAIGINAYEDKGWAAPDSAEVRGFPPLGLAVGDATAFAAEMEKAASGLYEGVRRRTVLDRDATPENLERIVREMATEINPRDTFVLYAAAHGYSINGSYYMIPQDYQGGANPEALKSRAIGQDRLQDWIANRVKAKKALILLDTCESGALVGGYTKSRTDAPASEAAVGRLHEATGRPVLTAAAAGKPAFEGYKGHGVFTYALMEALQKGDTNGNGKIELTELAAHVQRRVPELAAELGEHGGVVKGTAVIAMRGAEGDKQSAHFGSTGEDFAVAARLP